MWRVSRFEEDSWRKKGRSSISNSRAWKRVLLVCFATTAGASAQAQTVQDGGEVVIYGHHLPTDPWADMVAKMLRGELGQALTRSFGPVGSVSGGTPNVDSDATAGKAGATLTDTEPSTTNPETCHPVIIKTGEKNSTESDFSSRGLYGLALSRTYRSSLPAGQLFGTGWVSNLEVSVSADFSYCYRTGPYCFARSPSPIRTTRSGATATMPTGCSPRQVRRAGCMCAATPTTRCTPTGSPPSRSTACRPWW